MAFHNHIDCFDFSFFNRHSVRSNGCKDKTGNDLNQQHDNSRAEKLNRVNRGEKVLIVKKQGKAFH